MEVIMTIDRVEEWKKFSRHMEKYIKEQTVEKYGLDKADSKGLDLMEITKSPLICVWQILKYSLRIWNNKMKPRDIEKIAHYAEFSWTISKGQIIKNDH
jgi:hypothetical protein